MKIFHFDKNLKLSIIDSAHFFELLKVIAFIDVALVKLLEIRIKSLLELGL